MKIPRLTSGPLCYTLEQWAIRMGFSDLTLGITIAAVCFYLSSVVDSNLTSNDVDKDALEVSKTIFIAVGVIFCIPAFFAILLLVGLFSVNKKLLSIWVYYMMVGCVLYIIFLFSLGIFAFVEGHVSGGFIMLAVGVLLAGHQIYSALIVHGIYLNIKEEEEETHTSHAQS